MMNIKISRTDKTATVHKDNKILKTQQLNPEEFKEIMSDLTDKAEVDIDMLRLWTKKFKVSSFDFRFKE
jgi:ArsR family metal-binding transcriptional regulator